MRFCLVEYWGRPLHQWRFDHSPGLSDLTPGLSATPLSINGEGEWTSAYGRCDKYGEGEWTSAYGRCDKYARGNGHLPTADVTNMARWEWTSAYGRCDKYGEVEWTSAYGRCDKYGEGE